MQGYDPLKSDVWSVGVVLFVLLHGFTPWDIARDASSDYRLYKHTEVCKHSQSIENASLLWLSLVACGWDWVCGGRLHVGLLLLWHSRWGVLVGLS